MLLANVSEPGEVGLPLGGVTCDWVGIQKQDTDISK